MINIQKNDYVQPFEIREEVVQAICNAFFSTYSGIYHPFHEGRRYATIYVVTGKGKSPFFSSSNESYWGKESKCYRIRGCEMKQAFEELIKVGYYMFRVYQYDTWLGYVCKKTPFYHDHRADMVEAFTDRID